MVECRNLPDNPNSFANRVRTARQSQLDGARNNLANSRELKFRAYFQIDAAPTLAEKKKFGSSYRLGVLGVVDAAIVISDQKIREHQPLEVVPQEITSRTNSIKLGLEIQLGREADQSAIRSVIEELGIHASIDTVTDRIREVVSDLKEIDRDVIRKAVKVTDKSVSLVRRIQKQLGVKEYPSEYEEVR